jgi:acetolactate synthase-1/2/3 large subunit
MTATPLNELARRSGRAPQTVSEAVVGALKALGVTHAFGVSGGAIAPLWGALSASEIEVVHFRHETGAAFAAIEAHFATSAPVVVFTTTGPGLTNALTGMLAARGEGAKIVLVSACTTAAHRGRGAIQETDSDVMPLGLSGPGALFHFATVIESVESLPQVFRRVANGLARPGGFVCHLSIPTGLQTVALTSPMPRFGATASPNRPDDSVTERCARCWRKGRLRCG